MWKKLKRGLGVAVVLTPVLVASGCTDGTVLLTGNNPDGIVVVLGVKSTPTLMQPGSGQTVDFLWARATIRRITVVPTDPEFADLLPPIEVAPRLASVTVEFDSVDDEFEWGATVLPDVSFNAVLTIDSIELNIPAAAPPANPFGSCDFFEPDPDMRDLFYTTNTVVGGELTVATGSFQVPPSGQVVVRVGVDGAALASFVRDRLCGNENFDPFNGSELTPFFEIL